MDKAHPLREWRDRTGTRLADLAVKVGVVPSHLSQIETGSREPSLALASRLSKITELPIDSFVRGEAAA